MAEKISRRTFGALAVGSAAALAIGKQGAAKKPEELTAEIAGDMAAIDKKLAKPLSKKARELTLAQLKNNKQYLKDRYKFELPENSEPCFVFVPRKGR
ncbi:MAG: hypothetical protein WAO58_11555 [Fimbriimonadaceae bacterium]